MDGGAISGILRELLPGVDEDGLEYFTGMVADSSDQTIDESALTEQLSPFIESYGLAESPEAAAAICRELCTRLRSIGMKDGGGSSSQSAPSAAELMLDKPLVLAEMTSSLFNKDEKDTIDTLWGFDTIRQKRNETIEMTEAGSAKYERKAMKDQKKWLEELENKFPGEEEDNAQISAMTLPGIYLPFQSFWLSRSAGDGVYPHVHHIPC